MTEKKLPHLAEAIDQMEAYIKNETDEKKIMWLGEILESMRRARWDDYERLGRVCAGYCTFKSTGKREWL